MRTSIAVLASVAALAAAVAGAGEPPIAAARLLVNDFPAIPLSLGEIEDLPYAPGTPAVAVRQTEFNGEIPLDHPSFGSAGLRNGMHSYVVEIEDSSGRTSRSERRFFRVEGRANVAAFEWLRVGARWNLVGSPPATPTREDVEVPSPDAVFAISGDANTLGAGLKYYYVRAIDEYGVTGPWREYVHEVGPKLSLIRAEWSYTTTTTGGAPIPVGTATRITLGAESADFTRPFEILATTSSLPAGPGRPKMYLRVQQLFPGAAEIPPPPATGPRWGDWQELELNRCPVVDSFSPTKTQLFAAEGTAITFGASGSDRDGDPLTVRLSVNGVEVGSGPSQVTHTFATPGGYTVVAALTDGDCETTVQWTVHVAEGTGWMAR